jgi:hypothetical protein
MYLTHVMSLINLNSQIILLVLFSHDLLLHFIYFPPCYLFFSLIPLAGNHFFRFFHYFTLIVKYLFFCFREDVVASLLLLNVCCMCFVGFLYGLYLRCFRLCLDLGTGLWTTQSLNYCCFIVGDLIVLEKFLPFHQLPFNLETFLILILEDLLFFIGFVIFYWRCLVLVLYFYLNRGFIYLILWKIMASCFVVL